MCWRGSGVDWIGVLEGSGVDWIGVLEGSGVDWIGVLEEEGCRLDWCVGGGWCR